MDVDAPFRCLFCRLQNPSRQPLHPVDYDCTLHETAHFLVTPAIGALTVGHVLIVSRQHTPGLAYLSPEALDEYAEVVRVVASHSGGGRLLQAEHGGSHDHPGGGCISHTHVNCIPGLPPMLAIFEGHLTRLDVPSFPSSLLALRKPYILLREGETTSVYAATNVPSQLIRRRICEAIDRQDWDWAVHENLEIVQETIRLWERQ